MPEWASEGYAKFTKTNSLYVLVTLDRGPVILLPPGQMKTVYRLPEDRLDVFGTLQEQIQAKYTVRDQRIIRDPFHRHLIPSQLTRELDLFTASIVAEIDGVFQSSWGDETGWKDVPVWQTCFQAIARATNSTLYGRALCREKKYIQLLEGQSAALFGGSILISITPEVLRPLVAYLKIANICSPYIEQRINKTIEDRTGTESSHRPTKDGLQLIIDEAISRGDSTELSARLIADRLLITNNVTLNGVAFTVHHILLNIVSSEPSLGYIEALREEFEECEDAVGEAGGIWSLEAVRKLKLMDSTIRESMRISPFSSVVMARTVVDPQGIPLESGGSSILIPRGVVLALPVESIHYDEKIYPDAQRFNPYRFVSHKPRNGESKGQRYATSKPTTTADDHFFGFGTSKNPCPGRFLAALNYDIKYTKANYQPSNFIGMKVPKMNVHLRVKRRSS
ncbi:cytochrome P450 [Biscogniauxia marginata]|nr:cytochrome P450 [Biscogniauxia marginata]